jgi:putative ABC transport system permease protein
MVAKAPILPESPHYVRTESMLAMYSLVILVIVLLIEISSIISYGVGSAVRHATAGWGARADYTIGATWNDPQSNVTSGGFAGRSPRWGRS